MPLRNKPFLSSGDWRGRRVGVIGAGRSGVAAAKLLSRVGARVLLSESGHRLNRPLPSPIEIELGGHSDRLLECELLIRSPGVPNHLPIIKKARARGIPLWSELELASRCVRPRLLVAITGTNGKTTTTTLAYELFKARYGRRAFVGGNIGTPLSEIALKMPRNAVVVLEVSSYQLEDIDAFHPALAAILNITPDHLEHHGTLAKYAAAKARIFENQSSHDVCVLNADDAWCRRLAARCPSQVFLFSRRSRLKKGIFFADGRVHLRWGGKSRSWPLDWRLPGTHNVENGLAAVALAIAAGIPVTTIEKVFRRFKGVEHRLENVRELKGVLYINDSKATNVDSTRVALASFERPLIVIMGGQGKGSPYTVLAPLIKKHAKKLLLIGEDAGKIRREIGAVVGFEDVKTMARAVRRARQLARPGDVVLLSPACASFDQYKNYEERGRHFKSLVKGLS